MVLGAPHALTKVSFRRDVRLFLASLVGLLVFVIAALLLGFGKTAGFAEDRAFAQWNTAADAAADSFRQLPADVTAGVVKDHLTSIRSRFDIASAAFRMPDGSLVVSGATIGLTQVERRVRGGTLICYFDASDVQNARRIFVMLAAICASATIGGTILLLMYLPKITRPIELMLDQAAHISEREAGQEDTQYLVDTFRKSVAVLREQEEELRHLHALQKTRADDLERLTRALTRSIMSGFLAIDRDGYIVDANASARELISRPSVQGASIADAFGHNAFSTMLIDAFERRHALTRAEAELPVGDVNRLIGLTTVPLTGDDEEFLGMLALFTDLTPIRELEGRVREMKNLADLGEIAAGIAHEFRNSLSTILGYLRLSRRSAGGDGAVAAIEKAEREANGLAAAVDSLLSFSRPMDLIARPVDLVEVTETVTERVRVSTAVDMEFDGETAVIAGDPALLDRAIENVIRNAADSVRRKGDGGSVRVRVSAAPTPTITVTDDGVGVDPAEVPMLFLPFRSNSPNGHGLGLPLAKKIVLLHGGTIRLTGQPGRGATATIEFKGEMAASEPAAGGADTFRNT